MSWHWNRIEQTENSFVEECQRRQIIRYKSKRIREQGLRRTKQGSVFFASNFLKICKILNQITFSQEFHEFHSQE